MSPSPPAANSRSDLASLSDADLAERLTSVWRAYDEAEQRGAKSSWLFSGRGLIRNPLANRFRTGLIMRVWGVFGAYPDMHLSLCEIRDIHDEIERRIGRPT